MNTHNHLRPLALVAAVLALTSTSTALAERGGRPGPDGPRGGRPGRGLPAELVQKYDANGDGQLDETERATLDADVQAGKVTPPVRPGHDGPGAPGDEGGRGRGGRRGPGGPPKEWIAKFDANGDGQLDQAEREALRNAVQSGEVKAPRPGHGGGGAGADASGRRGKALEKFDANHDGQLDEAERKAMHEARRAATPPAPPTPETGEGSGSGPAVIRKGPRR